jgi:hypothetical protein
MKVGNNKSTTTTNVGELLAILIAMWMWRYEAGCFAWWSTSRGSGMVQAWMGHFVTPLKRR